MSHGVESPHDGCRRRSTMTGMFSSFRSTAIRSVAQVRREERGDVPGWVLITLMTAGLVVVIWALAGPALSGLFQNAIDRVSGAGF
jgi:hypothetical protein